MEDFKTPAKAFELSLLVDLVSVADVVAWADSIIVNSEIPPHWVIDISLAGDKSSGDVVNLLHSVPGSYILEKCFKPVFFIY